jgi:uncharacterized membrane protein
MPVVICLAAVGFWRAHRTAAVRQDLHRVCLVGLVAMSWTMLAGLLLGITSYHARFEVHNPALFALTDWFTCSRQPARLGATP